MVTTRVLITSISYTKLQANHCANTLNRASARVNICNNTAMCEASVPRLVIHANITVEQQEARWGTSSLIRRTISMESPSGVGRTVHVVLNVVKVPQGYMQSCTIQSQNVTPTTWSCDKRLGSLVILGRKRIVFVLMFVVYLQGN